MKAANDILERRRSERNRDSRYVEGYSLSLPVSAGFPHPAEMASSRQERGRQSTRYSSLNLQQPPSRSATATSGTGNASAAGTDPTSGSLWGLLDMAQSWITGHTSRRDRSEERSKYLMRKTRPLWFHEIFLLLLLPREYDIIGSWREFLFLIPYLKAASISTLDTRFCEYFFGLHFFYSTHILFENFYDVVKLLYDFKKSERHAIKTELQTHISS